MKCLEKLISFFGKLFRRPESAGYRSIRMTVVLYVMAAVCVLYAVGILLTKAAGTRFYLVWFVMAAFFCTAGWLLTKNIWSLLPAGGKAAIIMFVCTAVFFFLLVEGLILSGFHKKAENGLPYIVVLGAQMKQNGPSVALARRLDAAILYLEENPDTVCIVSGGQGSNEPVSEAQGMFWYLTERGIKKERIIMEEQSRNTFENLVFSRKLIPEEITKIGIVTSNFHVYRACQLAKIHGFAACEGIGAGSGMYFLPNNMLREFFGVVKDWALNGMKLF